MNLPKEKFDLVREQVIAKIRWGTGDEEVRTWLAEKWAISGTMAENLIAEAHRAKHKAFEAKAQQTLMISGGIFLVIAIYLGIQQSKGKLELGGLTIVALIVGLVSLIFALKSLVQVMRGEDDRPVD